MNPARQRMSSVDRAWLRMDRPHNLMMICAVLVFEQPLGHAELKRTLEERFLAFERFRMRPLDGDSGAWWETDPAFDMRRHLVRARLARGDPRSRLQDLVSGLVATPLDPDHPRWQFHLIERYGGGSAVVARIHHAYADGIALIRVLLSLTDGESSPAGLPPVGTGGAESGDGATDDSGTMVERAIRTAANLVAKVSALKAHPEQALDLARRGGSLAAELARLATMGEDSRTAFKGVPGIAKRVAWADPVDLEIAKTIGRVYGASLNDVLLACVAGALRSYLVEREGVGEGTSIRALVPVNLRAEAEPALGNRFGLVFLDLPIGIENPVKRLYAVRAAMRSLKDSWQPVVALQLLTALGAAPEALQNEVLELMARNATAVMTNVPGPRETLHLAGATVGTLMFWVPQSGNIGMGVSILSYAGTVRFGLITDAALCPDPQHVIERFAPQFETLVLATLMAPWPWAEPPSADAIEAAACPGAR